MARQVMAEQAERERIEELKRIEEAKRQQAMAQQRRAAAQQLQYPSKAARRGTPPAGPENRFNPSEIMDRVGQMPTSELRDVAADARKRIADGDQMQSTRMLDNVANFYVDSVDMFVDPLPSMPQNLREMEFRQQQQHPRPSAPPMPENSPSRRQVPPPPPMESNDIKPVLNPPHRWPSAGWGTPPRPPMPENSPPPNPRPPAPPMPTGGHPRPGMPPMPEEQYGPLQPVMPTRDKLRFDPVPERPQAPSFNPDNDRLRAETSVSPEQQYKNFKAKLAGMDEPTWNSPEETMINTHMDNQRDIINGNNKAREGRRSYIPDAATEQGKTAARLRNKQTGQVDPMSNLNGRLAGLQASNTANRAKEEAENQKHSDAMEKMRDMVVGREAPEGAGPWTGTPISSRRIEGTDNGWGKEQTAGGMRRKHIKDREAARKENVERAKAAARNGEKFKQKLTGHDETDQYVGGAVASVQNTISRQKDDLKKQLMAADAASGGKLGYIKDIQEAEAAKQSIAAKLKGQYAAAKQKKKETKKLWKREDKFAADNKQAALEKEQRDNARADATGKTAHEQAMELKKLDNEGRLNAATATAKPVDPNAQFKQDLEVTQGLVAGQDAIISDPMSTPEQKQIAADRKADLIAKQDQKSGGPTTNEVGLNLIKRVLAEAQNDADKVEALTIGVRRGDITESDAMGLASGVGPDLHRKVMEAIGNRAHDYRTAQHNREQPWYTRAANHWLGGISGPQ
mgnify:FL=1